MTSLRPRDIHAELAQIISVPCYYGVVDPNIAYPRARACVRRALQLDPNIAEAHEVEATTLKNYDWNWEAAEKEYRLTIDLNPNYATAHYHFSYLLAEQGRFDEAIHEATEALARDPMSGILNAGLAFVLLHARMLDRCIEQARTTIEVDPTMVLSYWTLGIAFEQKGDYAQALDAYHKSLEFGAAPVFSRAFLAHAYAQSGQIDKARVFLHEITELSKTRYVPWMAFVIAYEGLREINLALDYIEKSCDSRETNLIQIKVWYHFDALRNHPRFHAVERRVGLRK